MNNWPIFAVKEEAFQVSINETEADVSIGTEIPDLEEPTDDFQNLEILPPYTSINEDPCTSSVNFNTEDDHGEPQIFALYVFGS